MADINFSIRIIDGRDRAREGMKVFVSYSDWTHDEDYTDDDGWVSFEKGTIIHDCATIAELIVDGDIVDKNISIEDGDTFSYTVDYDYEEDDESEDD